jgi:hypothetical protein
MNKRALIGGLTATLGMINIAAAQAPDRNAPTGPYNPNPPANAPDLRLPPPCAPAPNLAPSHYRSTSAERPTPERPHAARGYAMCRASVSR